MQWMVPVVMGAWAVLTWAHNHDKERRKERSMLAAQYVNPFISAGEDLQSRIYKILELGGLDSLRERYPDGAFAEETLYLLVRFFGWSTVVNRYGPYTQDPFVIDKVTAIRRTFSTASRGYSVGPFNFFLPEQKSLGKIVMYTLEGEHGFEFDTISYYDFKEQLNSAPLKDSQAVRQTLETLREAKTAEDIVGRERLAEAQNYIFYLLSYLEEKEGYTLFQGTRQVCSINNN
jgi:hypothetical protein